MRDFITKDGKSFEKFKKLNEYGTEYWSAREIQQLLGYTKWRNFEEAISRAIISCKYSDNIPSHHFYAVNKKIKIGSGRIREVVDYYLSRLACYLIAQNGDPRKPEIAKAQVYFAVQTRKYLMEHTVGAGKNKIYKDLDPYGI